MEIRCHQQLDTSERKLGGCFPGRTWVKLGHELRELSIQFCANHDTRGPYALQPLSIEIAGRARLWFHPRRKKCCLGLRLCGRTYVQCWTIYGALVFWLIYTLYVLYMRSKHSSHRSIGRDREMLPSPIMEAAGFVCLRQTDDALSQCHLHVYIGLWDEHLCAAAHAWGLADDYPLFERIFQQARK